MEPSLIESPLRQALSSSRGVTLATVKGYLTRHLQARPARQMPHTWTRVLQMPHTWTRVLQIPVMFSAMSVPCVRDDFVMTTLVMTMSVPCVRVVFPHARRPSRLRRPSHPSDVPLVREHTHPKYRVLEALNEASQT